MVLAALLPAVSPAAPPWPGSRKAEDYSESEVDAGWAGVRGGLPREGVRRAPRRLAPPSAAAGEGARLGPGSALRSDVRRF